MLSIGTTEELGMLNISHMVLISTYFPNHQNLDSQQQDTWILLALFFFRGGGFSNSTETWAHPFPSHSYFPHPV